MTEQNKARLRQVGHQEQTVEKVRLTPQLAKRWMAQNPINRALRSGVVSRLADAIKRGEWMLNGETIKFDWNGNMLDGQHRTAAAVEANQAIDVFVVRGLDPRSQETVDRGIRRTLADIIKLRGESYAPVLAAGINTYHRIQTGTLKYGAYSGRYYPSIQQAVRILEENPRIREGLAIGHRLGVMLKVSAGVTTACRLIFMNISETDAIYFFEKLLTGSSLEEGDPILVLRNEFLKDMVRTDERKHQLHEKAALLIKAWNHYRRGEKVERLSWRSGGSNPEEFPQPV